MINYPNIHRYRMRHAWENWIFLGLAALGLIAQCALPMAPDGGPRDVDPPVIVKANVPYGSTQMHGQSMQWTFDEFVKLHQASQQIICSPPLPESVTYELKGKTLSIAWKGDLMPESTYNMQWGSAVKDLHEGNVLKGFQWVWSTGSNIDSGMIHGQLVDLTGEQLGKDLSLCLYPIDAQDSCLLGPPLYSTRSDDSGRAHFHHVKPGSYQLRAFLDKDGNNRLSEGERSPIAWSVAHTDSSNHSLELPLTKLPSDSLLSWRQLPADSSGTLALHVNLPQVKKGMLRLVKQDGIYREWNLENGVVKDSIGGLPPGQYALYVVVDINGNGALDAGSYWAREVSDQILRGPDVEVRANWHVDHQWVN